MPDQGLVRTAGADAQSLARPPMSGDPLLPT
jgi:hypothetical protein